VTKYVIEIMPTAKGKLSPIQKKDAKRIIDKIESLSEDPRPRRTEKLKTGIWTNHPAEFVNH